MTQKLRQIVEILQKVQIQRRKVQSGGPTTVRKGRGVRQIAQKKMDHQMEHLQMEHLLPLSRLRHPPVPRKEAIPPLAAAAGCVGGKIRRTRRRSKKFYPSPKGQLLAIRTSHFFKLKLRMILRKTRYLGPKF